MLNRIINGSRLSILIAVLCSFVISITLLLYGAAQTFVTVELALKIGHSSSEAKTIILSFIEIIDLFLLATVFHITALGLYSLFIDERLKVPPWLEIHNLDDLKGKLVSVVIVILSVLFLGRAVKWEGGIDILPFGVSIALVSAALTYFLNIHHKKPKMESDYSGEYDIHPGDHKKPRAKGNGSGEYEARAFKPID
ncbi:MAG: YqhA family protein [Leptolyngbyaceae cyanobacterium CSU_1_3]|nr:YqhA family protein [Leptolyngbyaceae cyanobacterium CSU_1_3]